MDEVVASNVDGSFAEDEVQAVFGMGGMGKGNKKEMGAMGGKSAQQNLADVQKSLPGIDVGIDMPSVDLSAAQAELEKLWEQVTGLFKIVFGYLQVVSTLAVNLPSVPWPSELSGIWDAVAVVNIDLFSAFSVDCFASDIDFTHTFMSTILYPIAFVALILIVTWVRQAGTTTQQEENDVVTEGWKVGLLFLFIIYPSVSSTILKMWHCRDIEGTWYLYADYRITCDGDWATYATIAGVAFAVYPIGIPLMFWYLLSSNKDALHDESHRDHQTVQARYSFLYRSYEEEAWWWELVMLMQK